MKTRPLLWSFLMVSLLAGCLALAVAQAIHQVRSQAGSIPRLHVHYDQGGDLWIETPLYIWNITSGEGVSVDLDGAWQLWQPPGAGPNQRFVDSLFLSQRGTGPLRSRITFVLNDRALVYLERDTPPGVEALELAFRANDGLVRVTHAWLGDEVPSDVQAAASNLSHLEGQFVKEMMEGLSAEERVHLAANYSRFVRFDPEEQRAQEAFLDQENQRTGHVVSGCTTTEEAQQQNVPGGPADDPCRFQGFYLPGKILGSEYMYLFHPDGVAMLGTSPERSQPLNRDLPDLDAAYIQRTPRYSYRAAKNGPAVGDVVTFTAHIANMGRRPSGPFEAAWWLDGVPLAAGIVPSLAAGQHLTLSQNWTWQSGPHTVTLKLDPADELPEISEQNNVLADRTDALAVGFWVEQSVYDYFNVHQVEQGLGSLSWEDWAQRQLAVLNRMFARAVYPLTPDGVLERLRLDQVRVVPDGSLPACATREPDLRDETVDLQWGFPAELVGIDAGHTCGELNYYLRRPDTQAVDYDLLHELSHVRYLIDLYGLNVEAGRATLVRAIDATATALQVDQDAAAESTFPAPVYLALGGELLFCQSKTQNGFEDCERGAEGTVARPHAVGAALHLAVVLIQDGRGNLVQGSADLPVNGDLLYEQPYPADLMAGGTILQAHSAYAWNRIAGQRPCCGNTHPAADLGVYLNDLPAQNIIEVVTADGQPVADAQVEVYRARPLPVWYGKSYPQTPDAVHFTDAQGQAPFGPNPFTGGGPIVHRFGYSNAVLLLHITASSGEVYRFLDVTVANEAYWAGNRDQAVYRITLLE